MNLDERMKNYHWSEIDISKWATSKINEELEKRDYTIVKLDVFVKICTRMNSLGLIYIINMDVIKDKVSYILTNFTTTHEKNEGLCCLPWFLDFFKELEAEALLKYSKKVLNLQETERKSVAISNVKANLKKTGCFSYTSFVNCPPEEFINFLTVPEFMRSWGVTCEQERFFVSKVEFRIVKQDTNFLQLDFKLKEWEKYTKVEIKLQDIRGNSKISISQTDVPISDIDILRATWKESILLPICGTFGFIEKPFYDD